MREHGRASETGFGFTAQDSVARYNFQRKSNRRCTKSDRKLDQDVHADEGTDEGGHGKTNTGGEDLGSPQPTPASATHVASLHEN